MQVPPAFRSMPRWWHDDAGRQWLDQLPALIGRQCEQWGLRPDGSPMHGSNALVVPVVRGDGANRVRLALRLAPPGDDVAPLARALAFWDGQGTVELVAVDHRARALLLERLDGSRTLLEVPVREAAAILAGAIARLAVAGAPADVPRTQAVAAAAAREFTGQWEAAGRPVAARLLEHAVAAAERLAVAAGPDLAVDADLHGEQVLRGRREAWLVVDPVLMRGDPGYDVARILWSRMAETPDDDTVVDLFDVIVAGAGLDRSSAADWVLLRSLSYLLWGLEHGLTIDPPHCRRLLQIFAG